MSIFIPVLIPLGAPLHAHETLGNLDLLDATVEENAPHSWNFGLSDREKERRRISLQVKERSQYSPLSWANHVFWSTAGAYKEHYWNQLTWQNVLLSPRLGRWILDVSFSVIRDCYSFLHQYSSKKLDNAILYLFSKEDLKYCLSTFKIILWVPLAQALLNKIFIKERNVYSSDLDESPCFFSAETTFPNINIMGHTFLNPSYFNFCFSLFIPLGSNIFSTLFEEKNINIVDILVHNINGGLCNSPTLLYNFLSSEMIGKFITLTQENLACPDILSGKSFLVGYKIYIILFINTVINFGLKKIIRLMCGINLDKGLASLITQGLLRRLEIDRDSDRGLVASAVLGATILMGARFLWEFGTDVLDNMILMTSESHPLAQEALKIRDQGFTDFEKWDLIQGNDQKDPTVIKLFEKYNINKLETENWKLSLDEKQKEGLFLIPQNHVPFYAGEKIALLEALTFSQKVTFIKDLLGGHHNAPQAFNKLKLPLTMTQPLLAQWADQHLSLKEKSDILENPLIASKTLVSAFGDDLKSLIRKWALEIKDENIKIAA